MSAIRRCPDHGFFERDRCPACDDAGRDVLDADRRRRLSKFLSGALRHAPDDAGLTLDDAGWTSFDGAVAAAEDRYGWADREAVAGVVATDPKGRFERTGGPDRQVSDGYKGGDRRSDGREEDGDRDLLRAAYGHSVDVDLAAADTPVPDALFHGTPTRNLDAIRRDGLRPMSRQEVHLTESVAEAVDVGLRHGDDLAILEVDAAGMTGDGYRITRRGRGVYTTDAVPPEYLSVRSE